MGSPTILAQAPTIYLDSQGPRRFECKALLLMGLYTLGSVDMWNGNLDIHCTSNRHPHTAQCTLG
jgi:hypothetical protein